MIVSKIWRQNMMKLLLCWTLLAIVGSCSADEKEEDGPPGLVDMDSNQDLVAEATQSGEAQKREAPAGGLSNSYGEPLPADVYGPPLGIQHNSISLPALPIPVYGVPNHLSNHIKYPEPPPDIPPEPQGAYGPPKAVFQNTINLPGPSVEFQKHFYQGPPPPISGPPKPVYGPPKVVNYSKPNFAHPKPNYGPPKPIYGPPKPVYGPPKTQFSNKPSFGPPKNQFGPPKPQYGPPKPQYGPPKPQYGPPKPIYGPPKPHIKPSGPPKPIYGIPKPDFGPPPPKPDYGVPPPFSDLGPTGGPNFGLLKPDFGHPIPPPPQKGPFGPPNPVYGPPILNLPTGLAPNFPIPSDTYGPPGLHLGSVDSVDNNLLLHDGGGHISVHYGPPQPDPNPRPPHPGIPAPPTPPHVLYDGWKPIPGVSHPNFGSGPEHHGHSGHLNFGNVQEHHGHSGHLNFGSGQEHHGQSGQPNFGSGLEHHGHSGHDHHSHNGLSDNFGPPPPPPIDFQVGGHILDGPSLPDINYGSPFNGNLDVQSHIVSSGYSSVSGTEGLKDIDINSILGSGDQQKNIEGSKTVFEAHYIEGSNNNKEINNIHESSWNHGGGDSLAVVESVGFQLFPGSGKQNGDSHHGGSHVKFPAPISDSYGAPPPNSFSHDGPYPSNLRQQSSKSIDNHIGLVPPSGVYGVPPGGKYGVPPPVPPHNRHHLTSHPHLPLSYGVPSGSVGGHSYHTGGNPPKYPIKFREPVPAGLIEDIGNSVIHKEQHGTSHGHGGPPYLPPPVHEAQENSQNQQGQQNSFTIQASIEPTNLYSLPSLGSPISFQSVVHQQPQDSGQAQGLYGSQLDSYSVPLLTVSDSYGAPSNQHQVATTIDGTNIVTSNLDAAAILKHCPYHEAILKAAKGGEKISQELASSYVASLSSLGSNLAQNQAALSTFNTFNTPVPGSESVNYNTQDLATASHTLVSTILPESNAIKGDSKVEKLSLQKGKSLTHDKDNSEKQKEAPGQSATDYNHIPVHGKLGSYTLQIQSADGVGTTGGQSEPVAHEQVLSEGLLQSILQAIEQPQNRQVTQQTRNEYDAHNSQAMSFTQDHPGLVLPSGYDFVDQKILDQVTQMSGQNLQYANFAQINPQVPMALPVHNRDCHHEEILQGENSIRHSVAVPPPNNMEIMKRTEPDVVTPLNIVDDNEIAVYFNNYKNENEKSDNRHVDDVIPVTEISVETTISEHSASNSDEDEGSEQRNGQQYGDAENKKNHFDEKLQAKIQRSS